MRKNQREGKLAGVTFMLVLSIGINILTYVYYNQKKGHPEVIVIDNTIEQQTTPEAYFADQLNKLFTMDELVAAAQRQWECVISANGKEFKNNTLYVHTNNIRVLVAEVAKDSSVMPEELLKLGTIEALSDEITLQDHLQVYSQTPFKVTREETGEGIKYYYDFEEVPLNSMITIQMSKLVKERLRYKAQIKEERLVIVNH